MRKLVAAGAIAAAMGGAVLSAAPAQADMNNPNQGEFAIAKIQTCRGIAGAVPGWAGEGSILGSNTDTGNKCSFDPSNSNSGSAGDN